MRAALAEALAEVLTPRPRLGIIEWSSRHVSLPEDYPSPYRGGGWSLVNFPLMREPMLCLDDPSVQQLTMVKCSQAGASFNLLQLPAMRAAAEGLPVLYVSGQAMGVEQFVVERIKPLVRSCSAFHGLDVRERDQELYVTGGGIISAVHASSKQGVKSRSFALLLADECDLYSHGVLSKLRSRLRHYAGGKLVVVSAPDPDAERIKVGGRFLSPIVVEWEASSQAHPVLKDPVTGNPFPLEWGWPDEQGNLPSAGIRWSPDAKQADGTWDVEAVRKSAFYLTPDGTHLDDAVRSELLHAARWEHAHPERTSHRGYMMTALHLPQVRVGDLAVGFLNARDAGPKNVVSWTAENLAECRGLQRLTVNAGDIGALCETFSRGDIVFEAPAVAERHRQDRQSIILGVDVQQAHTGLFWLAVGIAGRDVYVIDWGREMAFADVEARARSLRATYVACDVGYDVRRQETLEACLRYRWAAVLGRPKISSGTLWEVHNIDLHEGKKGRTGGDLRQISFVPDQPKMEILEGLAGRGRCHIHMPRNIDAELAHQLSSERWEGGAFVQKHDDNHMLDCLVYALLLGRFHGVYR